MKNAHISVVIPVYKAESLLEELYNRLSVSLKKITDSFEIILVEDCGGDRSWEKIKITAEKDPRVKGIKLSKNFGQHYAIKAGLDVAQGDWVVVMDCDLQDQPEEIHKLYEKALEGYELVVGERFERKDKYLKKLTSKIFYSILKYFSGIQHNTQVAAFGIYSRKVIASTGLYREQYQSFGMFINIVGYARTSIPLNHAKRPQGKSTYSFNKKLNLAIDTIIAFSNKPLKASIKFGFLIAFSSILYAIYRIIQYFTNDLIVPGWTSVIVSIFFVGGLMFMNLGILGLYISKVYDETKNRPIYLITETTFRPE